MDSFGRLDSQIQQALATVGLPGLDGRVEIVGQAAHGPVSDLAVASVSAAASMVGSLIGDRAGQSPMVTVDRGLVDQWCRRGFESVGWTVPAVWDQFARDYRTRDGRVRFHTNAAHHRAAALSVLGGVTTVEAAEDAVAHWTSSALEEAVYNAGGCAVELRTTEEWSHHEQGRAVEIEPVIAWSAGETSDISWRPTDGLRPLAGLKVLDLTRVIAGPVATRSWQGVELMCCALILLAGSKVYWRLT